MSKHKKSKKRKRNGSGNGNAVTKAPKEPKVYTVDHKFHINKYDLNRHTKSAWDEALCGKYIQFFVQNVNWLWCKQCFELANKLVAKDKAGRSVTKNIAKHKPTIVVQRFDVPLAVLERIESGIDDITPQSTLQRKQTKGEDKTDVKG